MKKSTILLYAVMFILATFVFLQGASIFAQASFVKYAGNPILPLGNPGEWDDTEASHAHVSFDGATYQMWYSGAPQENTYRIGYAASVDGLNWIKDATNPVLNVGGAGTFDSISLWLPAVLFDGSRYEMWYSGGLTISGIGYATSLDPVSWVRQGSGPVLDKGDSGAWDQSYAFHPVVMRSDTLYHMWYTGRSASDLWETGYATSTDGISWSKYPNNPVLAAGAPGKWDARYASAGTVLFENGQYHMWYHGGNANDFSQVKIGYATSTDGVNWTKHEANPILQPGPGNWDAKNVWFPSVIKEGHRYRMWYTGTFPGTTIDRLGYAEDFSNAAHVDSISVSRKTAVAGSHTIDFYINITNPHSEDLAARALIVNDDGSVNESVDLVPVQGRKDWWWGKWATPAEPDNYSVGVELNNISAGYLHNSYDWGVFEEFRSYTLSRTFTQTAHIDDGGDQATGMDVKVAPDGTIFLANYGDGLRAYRYDGTSFTNTAHIDAGGIARDVALASDGTVFLANGDDGLRAYSYDGNSFTNTAHINEGSVDAYATAVAVGSNGIVFLANSDGLLQAYSYDGTAFTLTASIHDSTRFGGYDLRLASDGTVFLANGRDDGLRVYQFEGNSFNSVAHDSGSAEAVVIASDNTVFVAGFPDDLRAYRYYGTSLTKIAQIENKGYAGALALASDGTIFLVNEGGIFAQDVGLWAFSYDNTSFTNTAYIYPPGGAGVTVTDDGTIFLAGPGLFAFTYDMATGIADNHSSIPENYVLWQNYPNPFNPTTTIEFSLPQNSYVTLKVYNLLGQEVASVLEAYKSAGRHTVTFDASALASGLYYYTLTAGNFKQARKMLLLR